MAGITSMAALAWMSRRRNRSAEADHCSGSPLRNAPVDVFIATYNEPFEILERTIIAATCIEHTDLRVWVLDDGARPWVQALAEELGALYTEVPPNVPANRLKRLGFLALLCLRVVFQAE
jgi:cellulose synthase (UDP-forming)